MKIDGRCHCGEISFEADVDPETVEVCHCTDCQALSGSAYRSVVPALEGTFVLLSGEPRIYVKTAETGAKRAQAFCPTCGTPIYSTGTEPGPSLFGIRLGAVRQRGELRPSTQYWCRSAQDWTMDLRAVKRVETQ